MADDLKVAVISDIHGYSIALDRVLADIASEGVDQLIVAGDLVEGGPDPIGVMERLQSLDAVILRGNTDDDIAAQSRDGKLAKWTARQVGRAGRKWLADLRFDYRLSPPNGRDENDDLLVVHANPFDNLRAIPPDATADDLRALIGKTRCAVLAFGHIHIAYIRPLKTLTLVDISAVGNPKDRDLRSKWGLLTWNGDRQLWSPEIRHVDYALDETDVQMRESGMPNAEKHIAKLKRASY